MREAHTVGKLRIRRVVLLLAACAVPLAMFAVGYAVTGAGAGAAPSAPTQTTPGDQTQSAAGPDVYTQQRDLYAKLPDRIGILGASGKPVGWADKSLLEPPAATGPFDPKTQDAWYDRLVPVVDDAGALVGYYLNGYGYLDRATAENPSLDRAALRSERAATAPLPPATDGTGAVGAAPAPTP